MEIYKERVKSNFDGTVIDIETIGDFKNSYCDSRRYKEIVPVIFGFIDKNGLKIYCAKTKDSIKKLRDEVISLLPKLKKPFYAFNSDFERGSLFHYLGFPVEFHNELNKEKFESKKSAVSKLKISNYDDPFNDDGLLCKVAWLNGEIDKSIAHNRSCLLKERDILKLRGHRVPDKLELINT